MTMPAGLFQAAVLTTAIALALVGGVLWRLAPPAQRRGLALLVLVELPMCALALWLVRPVWESFLKGALPAGAFYWARSLSAPLTEDLAKAWPLLFVPVAFRRPGSPATLGMALGLGFGLGEIWTVAHLIAPSPALASMPWYHLGGFTFERVGVCFAHGAFTSVLVLGVERGRPLMGLTGAMALHWLGNIPILIAHRYVAPEWRAPLLLAWTTLFFAAMILLLARLHFGTADMGGFLFGEADCPSCKTRYRRPLFGLNFGNVRYERCPACRGWHWV